VLVSEAVSLGRFSLERGGISQVLDFISLMEARNISYCLSAKSGLEDK
jgi:hypothetical protein